MGQLNHLNLSNDDRAQSTDCVGFTQEKKYQGKIKVYLMKNQKKKQKNTHIFFWIYYEFGSLKENSHFVRHKITNTRGNRTQLKKTHLHKIHEKKSFTNQQQLIKKIIRNHSRYSKC